MKRSPTRRQGTTVPFVVWIVMCICFAIGQSMAAAVLGLVIAVSIFHWAISSHLRETRRARG